MKRGCKPEPYQMIVIFYDPSVEFRPRTNYPDLLLFCPCFFVDLFFPPPRHTFCGCKYLPLEVCVSPLCILFLFCFDSIWGSDKDCGSYAGRERKNGGYIMIVAKYLKCKVLKYYWKGRIAV